MLIVYVSNTGTTEKYAKTLAERLNIKALPFGEAGKIDDEVIFMSWVQMGQLQQLTEARERFTVRAVIAVGCMGLGENAKDELIQKNQIDEEFFLLPGAFFVDKLSGMYKMMMKMALSMMKAKLKDASDEEKKMLSLLQTGVDFYDESKLDEVIARLEGEQTEKSNDEAEND